MSYPADVTQDMKDQLWTVFAQDKAALEAIQAGYDELGPDLREISVKADAAALSRGAFSPARPSGSAAQDSRRVSSRRGRVSERSASVGGAISAPC